MGFAYGEVASTQMSMEVDELRGAFFSHAPKHKASAAAAKNSFVFIVFFLSISLFCRCRSR